MNNPEVKYYEYFDNTKKCKAVKAVTTYAGKCVSAVSYTHPDDEYDFEFGKTIAKARLDFKIAIKRANSMRQRAERYAECIKVYKQEIKRMDKEMRKALSAAGDRLVDAHQAEKALEKLLDNI